MISLDGRPRAVRSNGKARSDGSLARRVGGT
jgi:hypothetical protein